MTVEPTQPQPGLVTWRSWRWVVEPCPHVTDPEARLHVRVISRLMLIVLPLLLIIEVLPNLRFPASDLWTDIDLAIPTTTIGVWALVYVLARRGYYRQATWITVLTASLAIFLAVLLPYYLLPNYDVQDRFKDLDYLALSLLLASTLLSLPAVRFLTVLNFLLIFGLLPFIPILDPNDILRPMSFVAVASVLILLLAYHRNTLEQYRTAQLKAANVRLVAEVQEREEAQQELLVEQLRYRGLFEDTSDGVVLIGLDGRIEAANSHAAALLGSSEAALIGRFGREFFSETERLVLAARGRMLLEGAGQLPAIETVIKRDDGTPWPIEVSLALVHDRLGVPSHFQTLLRDLSIRRQVETQHLALHSERQRIELLRDFVSKMSHDLRTPLTTIKTGLYLARRTVDQPERFHAHLDHVEEQVDHLAQVLENMLLMTRLDDPDVQVRTLTAISIQALFRSVISLYMPRIRTLGQDVVIEAPADLEVYADVEYLKEAVRQIVANAIAAAGQGGRIALRGRAQPGAIVLEVSDSGPGIPPEELPHIFERFYRGDPSRGTSTGGAGLGLSIVRRIVDLHGGQIELLPSAEDAFLPGVLFRMTIPTRPI